MIKVNLLPPRKKKAVVAGQRHLVIIIALLLVQCVVLGFIYQQRNTTLQAKKQANAAKAKEVERLKKEIGDLDRLKKEREELEKQQQILDDLERARSGPVRVLDEVAFSLTPATTERAVAELQRRKLNTTWDPRRISLKRFDEVDREVSISGEAKTNDDVAEFMKRLESSQHFHAVRLVFTKALNIKGLDVPAVTFDIRCRVSYSGKADEKPIFMSTQRRRGRRG